MVWLDEGGHQRDLRLVAAPPELSAVVEHFWIRDTPLPRNVWRIVPDLSAHVIFSITHSRKAALADCCVVGARGQFFDLDVTGRVLAIGARLRPGALPLLVRDSALHFTDRSISLADIYGPDGRWLIDRMVESPPSEALKHLTRFLTRRLGNRPTLFASDLLRSVTSVNGLADSLRITRRTAYKRISAAVGLPPKLMLRVHRLHGALSELNQGCSLADAAARVGYSDQAHFTREAAALLGEPPAAWRNRRFPFVQDSNPRRGR
jgi:AraC-like DNA-binding protein